MSSSRKPPPLEGRILRGDRVVGGFELNERSEAFIEQFNREYGRLGLRAERAAPRGGLCQPADSDA